MSDAERTDTGRTRPTFTGRDRQRRTRWTVRLADGIARGLITVGGIGTIVAVSLVCVFLAAVVVPLFRSARLTPLASFDLPRSDAPPVHVEVDEHQTIGWMLSPTGEVTVFNAHDGSVLRTQSLIEGGAPTFVRALPDRQRVICGFADGTARLATIRFVTQFIEAESLPAATGESAVGPRPYEGGMLDTSSADQYRLQTVEIAAGRPLEIADAPLVLADALPSGSGLLLAAIDDRRRLWLAELRETINQFTDEATLSLDAVHPATVTVGDEPPRFCVLTGRGDNLYLAWDDGRLLRIDTRRPASAKEAERTKLVETPGARLTALTTLLGRTTLVAGDSTGRVSCWFVVRRTSESSGEESLSLMRVHELPAGPAEVTAIGTSGRGRMLAAGFADGCVRVYHATSEKIVADVPPDGAGRVVNVVLMPKDDGLAGNGGGKWRRWRLEAAHPEASLKTLFGKVWYEGYPEPAHIWQSTSGSVDVEPKYGLVPLIFGTLKATFYSMLIGAPLALLAAIYTSEFLDRGTRARVKPALEVMASLPSVVLGFLAALIFAPFVERVVPAVIAAGFTIPLTIALAAYAWQLVPSKAAVRLARFRLHAIGLLLPLGALAAMGVGPLVERLLFSGDVMAWLDGHRKSPKAGSPFGGWLVLVLPLSAIGTGMLSARFLTPRLVERFGRSRGAFAMAELAKLAACVAIALVAASAVAGGLTLLGLDPRGSVVGTYVQRNAMVVGFVMGFAIIPIIYTIADDALTAVPEQLRSASLGAGATPWQTALRVVVPTAMSGLFSALMIGLGRAVGETMIVLMAGGNTPEIDVNPFNGFRTLAANIAVEIADAPPASTHYRILFLCGLTLFALTFIVNTLAEVVRQRFRRRMYQL